MQKKQAVGMIGLGLMGLPMAKRLLDAGIKLTVWNRTPEKAESLLSDGAKLADSIASLVASVDTVILMLADTPVVEAIMRGPAGVLEVLSPDTLVIDMGTTAVINTKAMAADVISVGGKYVDAPVSGGVIGAENGSLSIMAGGSAETFNDALPLLEILGGKITHVGDSGSGQIAKAANQVIVGLTIGAVAEGLALAAAAGADPARVRQALDGGFATSRILQVHGERMVRQEYPLGARCTTQRKDLQQALELAESLGLELPTTELCRDQYDRLIASGDADLDHAALYKLYKA